MARELSFEPLCSSLAGAAVHDVALLTNKSLDKYRNSQVGQWQLQARCNPCLLVQVVVAVDDSRSMGENGCGSFALEAVTLICRAMARLEVGEMGVVSYGGSNSILPLHPLEQPFTDANGPGIMAQMKFDQVHLSSKPHFLPDSCNPTTSLANTGSK